MSNFTPSSDNLLLGSGALYFDRFENGQKTGEIHFGNVTAFSISTSDEVKEKYQSMDKTRGLYKAVTTKRNITLKVTGDEFSPDNIALNVMGDQGVLTQTAGTVTAETVTSASKKGRYYPLAHRNVSDVVVKVGAATKVAGVDYAVDAKSGRIHILPTGSIADGSTVVADYDHASLTVNTINGGTAGLIEAFIRFVGDPASGQAYECQVWAVQLTPDGELGFISDDFGNWSLTGKVLNKAGEHPDAPYYKLIEL